GQSAAGLEGAAAAEDTTGTCAGHGGSGAAAVAWAGAGHGRSEPWRRSAGRAAGAAGAELDASAGAAIAGVPSGRAADLVVSGASAAGAAAEVAAESLPVHLRDLEPHRQVRISEKHVLHVSLIHHHGDGDRHAPDL